MPEFKKPALEDRQWASECVNASGLMDCEYSFSNIYIWSETYKTKIARYKDFLIARSGSGNEVRYSMPAGRGSIKEPLDEIIKDAGQTGGAVRLYGVTEPYIAVINELYPGRFSFQEYRDGFDYIYFTEKLARLSGKKYHSKKNHLNSFLKSYDWEYRPIDKSNIADCVELHAKWREMDRNRDRTDLGHEVCALSLALEHFFELGMFGAIIKADGQNVAFTLADRINDRVADVHFEKAIDEFSGAYAAINQMFCENALRGFEFVNREEDLGIEGLRKAKLSYHPDILLAKYTAVEND